MKNVLALAIVAALTGLVACSSHERGPKPQPPIDPAKVSVQLTAVTLGEDCGGSGLPAPLPIETAAPTVAPKRAAASKPSHDMAGERAAASMMRICQQTSIQLAIVSPTGIGPTELTVKKIELFDDKGTRIGELTAKAPVVWIDGAYKPWDAKAEPGKTHFVSYPASQPDWSLVGDRANRTFVVKVVVSVGGTDQPLERDVYIQGEARLPPGVVT